MLGMMVFVDFAPCCLARVGGPGGHEGPHGLKEPQGP